MRVFVPLTLITFLVIAFQNCSGDVPSGDNKASSQSSTSGPGGSTPSPTPGTISMSVSPAAPTTTDLVTLSGQNGTPGYTFRIVSGGGSVAGNVFTPGQAAGQVDLEGTDAAGRKANLILTVSATPTATLYRYVGEGNIVFYSDNGALTGFGDRNDGINSGSFKLYKNVVSSGIAIYKCDSGRGPAYIYFTANPCAPGYGNAGVYGYLSSSAKPNANTVIYIPPAGSTASISKIQSDVGAMSAATAFAPN